MNIYNYCSLTQNGCVPVVLDVLLPRSHLIGEIMFEGQSNTLNDPY